MTSHPERSTVTDVDNIIEEVGKISEKHTLPMAVFNDPTIHQLELERIFGSAWVFIGHESEVQEKGDYVKRYVGVDPFILVRDDFGGIQVLFNSCRHRGSTVIRAEQGNSSHFRCPYHNWTYRNDGELIGVPKQAQVYQELDKSECSLREAPRVDSYEGMVFASLDESAPSLEEYLGDFTWYLDMHLKFCDGGMEVVGEPIRWEIDTNWKLGADNFSGDSYHTLSTHKSVVDLEIFTKEYTTSGHRKQVHVTDCSGHTTGIGYFDDQETYCHYPEELFSREHVNSAQYELMKGHLVSIGTIFPNLSFIHAALNPDPNNRETKGFLSFRKWRPIGPETTEMWNWVLVPSEASKRYKELAYDTAMATFSVSGTFEQDDFAVWDGISEAAGSTFARNSNLELNYQMGIDEMGDVNDISDEWPGPGTVVDTNFEDGVMHTIHEQWYEYMRSGPENDVEGEQ